MASLIILVKCFCAEEEGIALYKHFAVIELVLIKLDGKYNSRSRFSSALKIS